MLKAKKNNVIAPILGAAVAAFASGTEARITVIEPHAITETEAIQAATERCAQMVMAKKTCPSITPEQAKMEAVHKYCSFTAQEQLEIKMKNMEGLRALYRRSAACYRGFAGFNPGVVGHLAIQAAEARESQAKAIIVSPK